MQQLHARHLLEQFARDPARRTAAAEADLARRSFSRSAMKSLTLVAGTSRVDHHDLAALAERRDRREILHRVVGQLLVQVLAAACVVLVVMSTV